MKNIIYTLLVTIAGVLGVSGPSAQTETTAEVSSLAGTANSAAYITDGEAKETALSHAGLSESEVTFVKAELDTDDGIKIYEIEFYSKNVEYDYDINAQTGDILSYDYDAEDYTEKNVQDNASSSSNNSDIISESKAKSIALSRVSGADKSDVYLHLDYDDGAAVYEGSVIYNDTEYEFEINAVSGKIIDWEAESVYDD